ncbi:MAG: hypothetical protein IGS54_13250 [Elainella sp. C42_A2020_010]|nr:hypothetical protein [Elainella sp. C42_A2020_010]
MSNRSPGRFESVVGNPIARILDPELVIKSATNSATTSTLSVLIAILIASLSGWTCIGPASAQFSNLSPLPQRLEAAQFWGGDLV